MWCSFRRKGRAFEHLQTAASSTAVAGSQVKVRFVLWWIIISQLHVHVCSRTCSGELTCMYSDFCSYHFVQCSPAQMIGDANSAHIRHCNFYGFNFCSNSAHRFLSCEHSSSSSWSLQSSRSVVSIVQFSSESATMSVIARRDYSDRYAFMMVNQ